MIIVKTHFKNYSSNEFDNILLKDNKAFVCRVIYQQVYGQIYDLPYSGDLQDTKTTFN